MPSVYVHGVVEDALSREREYLILNDIGLSTTLYNTNKTYNICPQFMFTVKHDLESTYFFMMYYCLILLTKQE